MTVTPRLSIRGAKRAQESLQAFAFDQAKFVEAGGLIMDYMRNEQREIFKSGGSHMGQMWPDYEKAEPKYGKMKKALIGKSAYPALLRWDGKNERLYPSLTRANHPEHVAIIDVGARALRFGTQVPYAINHQLGKGRNMFGEPIQARPFLSVTPRQAADIRRIIASVTGI